MIPGIDPKVDFAFKKVFGSEGNVSLLLHLLEAVLEPAADEQIVELTIRNPFNDKDALDDKLSVLDISARDRQGRQYNIEMQMVGARIFPQRVLYYWATLHSSQLRAGDDQVLLQPTISISFVNAVLFSQVHDYHLDFQPRSRRHPDLVFSRQQSIHVLELPKFRRSAEELASPLDVWCYFLIHGAELDSDQLPNALRTPAVRQALEVLSMLTQDERERELYQARLKAQRDSVSFVRDALAQGRQEGQLIGRIEVCQRLLALPPTPEPELLALPLEELRARAEALEQQLRANNPGAAAARP